MVTGRISTIMTRQWYQKKTHHNRPKDTTMAAQEPGRDRTGKGGSMYSFRDWLHQQGRLGPSRKKKKSHPVPNRKPYTGHNILWLMADQLRADTFGYIGHPFIKTPNLDKLAAGGAVFKNAYCSSPVCMPSRATMLTGYYLPRHGVYQNGIPMDPKMTTFVSQIEEAGYRTANIGKTHCGRPSTKIFEYHEHVEDLFGATKPSKVPFDPSIYPELKFVADEVCDYSDRVLYGKYPGPVQTTKSYILATQAMKWLYWHDEPRPFFLRVSFDDPHPPVVPPEPYASMYKPEEVPAELLDKYKESLANKPKNLQEYHAHSGHDKVTEEDHRIHAARYFGLVSHLDAQIGRILDYLDELGIADSTAVFFNADHGHMIGEHGFTHKGGVLFEGVSHIPTVIRWPGRIEPGTVVDGLVDGADVMPTLLDIAGCPVPETIPGKSMLPLAEKKCAAIRDHVFIEWDDYGFAVRDTRFKVCWWDCDDDGELYDLAADPLEKINLFHDKNFTEKRDELLAVLNEWRESTGIPRVAQQVGSTN